MGWQTRTIFRQRAWNYCAAAMCASLATALISIAVILPREPAGLTALAGAQMEFSGTDHPVTAVLLNFRSYDTWLELGVLFLGWLGVLAVRRSATLKGASEIPDPGHVLRWFVRLVVPFAFLVAGYLLWLGSFSPGGAFQAGVVAGAACVLLWLAGFRSVSGIRPALLKLALLAGFAGFAAAAAATAAGGVEMLRYPPEHAETIILLIEVLATISIGVTVAALFIALQPQMVTETKRS